jgi:hypothetical protein
VSAVAVSRPEFDGAPHDGGTPSRLRGRPPALLLLGALAAVAALYGVLAVLQPVPLVTPDEYTYGHLSWSLSAGHGIDWRGGDYDIRAALYVYQLTPVWWVGSSVVGYGVAKVLGTALLCTIAIPTYLLAREHVGPRVALVPAAMTVAGTWMLTGAGLMTENLAFPLSTASLAALVMAIRRPASRWKWLAIALALLAAWARMQMLALLLVVVAALALDVLRRPGERRARLRDHRVVLGLAAAVALVVIVAPAATIGSYGGITDARPSVGSLLSEAGAFWIDLVAMAAFAPAAALGVALSRRAWRDGELGPLLCVVVPAVAIVLVEAAFAVSGWDVGWSVQRYVVYPLPLLFILATVAATRIAELRWYLLAGAAVVCAGLPFSPGMRNALEERAVFATDRRVGDLLGTSTGASLTILALVACGAVALWALEPVRRRLRTAVPLLAVAVLAILAVQSQAVWSWQLGIAGQFRDASHGPLRWLDQHAGGDVARVSVTDNGLFFSQVEFFNRRLTRDYAPPGSKFVRHDGGRVCDWKLERDGAMTFDRRCGPAPTRLYFDDPFAHVTLRSQRVLADDPVLGRVVETGPHPRVLGILTAPCANAQANITPDQSRVLTGRPVCSPQVGVTLWLDEPGTLVLRFRGTEISHAIQAGPGRVVEIPAGRTTPVRWRIPAGGASLRVALDWQDAEGPALVGAEVTTPGRSIDLL